MAPIEPAIAPSALATSPSERATLWVQTSAEYVALTSGAYRSAAALLPRAVADPHWTAALEQGPDAAGLPPAIVLDVDETVLDNSPFQGSVVEAVTEGVADGYYPGAWDRWVSLAQARAVPGAPELVWTARALGVDAFYVTNRQCAPRPGNDSVCPQEADTLANLARAGFPPTDADHLLLRHEQPGWESEKSNRRALIAQSRRIVMLFGDDLGDFLPGAKGMPLDLREARARAARDWWGSRWIILPNPVYGSWTKALDPEPLDHLVALDALVTAIKAEHARVQAGEAAAGPASATPAAPPAAGPPGSP
jgi:acid phosphatase